MVMELIQKLYLALQQPQPVIRADLVSTLLLMDVLPEDVMQSVVRLYEGDERRTGVLKALDKLVPKKLRRKWAGGASYTMSECLGMGLNGSVGLFVKGDAEAKGVYKLTSNELKERLAALKGTEYYRMSSYANADIDDTPNVIANSCAPTPQQQQTDMMMVGPLVRMEGALNDRHTKIRLHKWLKSGSPKAMFEDLVLYFLRMAQRIQESAPDGELRLIGDLNLGNLLYQFTDANQPLFLLGDIESYYSVLMDASGKTTGAIIPSVSLANHPLVFFYKQGKEIFNSESHLACLAALSRQWKLEQLKEGFQAFLDKTSAASGTPFYVWYRDSAHIQATKRLMDVWSFGFLLQNLRQIIRQGNVVAGLGTDGNAEMQRKYAEWLLFWEWLVPHVQAVCMAPYTHVGEGDIETFIMEKLQERVAANPLPASVGEFLVEHMKEWGDQHDSTIHLTPDTYVAAVSALQGDIAVGIRRDTRSASKAMQVHCGQVGCVVLEKGTYTKYIRKVSGKEGEIARMETLFKEFEARKAATSAVATKSKRNPLNWFSAPPPSDWAAWVGSTSFVADQSIAYRKVEAGEGRAQIADNSGAMFEYAFRYGPIAPFDGDLRACLPQLIDMVLAVPAEQQGAWFHEHVTCQLLQRLDAFGKEYTRGGMRHAYIHSDIKMENILFKDRRDGAPLLVVHDLETITWVSRNANNVARIEQVTLEETEGTTIKVCSPAYASPLVLFSNLGGYKHDSVPSASAITKVDTFVSMFRRMQPNMMDAITESFKTVRGRSANMEDILRGVMDEGTKSTLYYYNLRLADYVSMGAVLQELRNTLLAYPYMWGDGDMYEYLDDYLPKVISMCLFPLNTAWGLDTFTDEFVPGSFIMATVNMVAPDSPYTHINQNKFPISPALNAVAANIGNEWKAKATPQVGGAHRAPLTAPVEEGRDDIQEPNGVAVHDLTVVNVATQEAVSVVLPPSEQVSSKLATDTWTYAELRKVFGGF